MCRETSSVESLVSSETPFRLRKPTAASRLKGETFHKESAMARKPPKTAVVAFKVEKELAELLNKLPNKSAFIRKAIAAQLGVACPLCQGKGMVPRGVHDHFAPLLAQFKSRSC